MKISDRISTERTKLVTVRLSKEEHAHLQEAAERLGMKVSPYMRMLALRENPMQRRAGMEKDGQENRD